jgi:hypothetical protein
MEPTFLPPPVFELALWKLLLLFIVLSLNSGAKGCVLECVVLEYSGAGSLDELLELIFDVG